MQTNTTASQASFRHLFIRAISSSHPSQASTAPAASAAAYPAISPAVITNRTATPIAYPSGGSAATAVSQVPQTGVASPPINSTDGLVRSMRIEAGRISRNIRATKRSLRHFMNPVVAESCSQGKDSLSFVVVDTVCTPAELVTSSCSLPRLMTWSRVRLCDGQTVLTSRPMVPGQGGLPLRPLPCCCMAFWAAGKTGVTPSDGPAALLLFVVCNSVV